MTSTVIGNSSLGAAKGARLPIPVTSSVAARTRLGARSTEATSNASSERVVCSRTVGSSGRAKGVVSATPRVWPKGASAVSGTLGSSKLISAGTPGTPSVPGTSKA